MVFYDFNMAWKAINYLRSQNYDCTEVLNRGVPVVILIPNDPKKPFYTFTETFCGAVDGFKVWTGKELTKTNKTLLARKTGRMA